MSSYVTMPELRKVLGFRSSSTDDDAKLLMLAEAVSRFIDDWCGRTFRIYQATLVFTPARTTCAIVPDLLSLTSLKTDLDQDGVYEETWLATDYYLHEPNAPVFQRPYSAIHTRPTGVQYFPTTWPMGLQVVGKWGFWEKLRSSVTTLSAAVSSTTTTSIAVAAAEVEVGQTILIDTEQMYVRGRSANGLTLTVDRGVNGTTAATHLISASVAVYEYPDPIVAAANLHAARVWRRMEIPTGVINTPGDIGWRAVYIPRFDTDTMAFLQPYRKIGRSFA